MASQFFECIPGDRERIVTPIGKEVTQPEVFPSQDQRLRKIRNLVEHEEPMLSCNTSVIGYDPGRDVVHHDQPVEEIGRSLTSRVATRAPRSSPTARSVRFPIRSEARRCGRHGSLFIAAGRLVALPISSQVRRDDVVAGSERRHLEPRGRACFRGAMQQGNGRAFSCPEVELRSTFAGLTTSNSMTEKLSTPRWPISAKDRADTLFRPLSAPHRRRHSIVFVRSPPRHSSARSKSRQANTVRAACHHAPAHRTARRLLP